MSISKHSGSKSLDWSPPWRVERPARTRPPLGPERDAWLEQCLLHRSAASLKAVLDRIDPLISRNEPVAELEEDAVTIALLELLEPAVPTDDSPPGKGRMPVHKARAFLSYFVRGFDRYCHQHHLRRPRLPLIREFSLDEGSLQAGTFSSLREYRCCVRNLVDEIDRLVITPESPDASPEIAAALLVCSATLFGGLARKVHWDGFITALSSSIHRYDEHFAFCFDQRRPYRWIVDPITEALLRRFSKCKVLPLPESTRASPSQIRHLLRLDCPTDSVPTHLERLVHAAHVRHYAPDVAAIAQGKIHNTPLADEPWMRLISGTRHPGPRTAIALAIPKITSVAQTSTLPHVALQKIIDDIASAIRWDPNELRRVGGRASREGQGVREYFSKATTSLRAIEGQLEQLYVRAGLPEGHRHSFAYGLLSYARDLLELGGLKVRNLAPSTISNYVGIIRAHLTPLHFSDLAAIGTETRADAYRSDIRQQLVRDRATHRTAFEGLERSLLRHMDIIDEVDWSTIPGRARNRHLPNVDANLIDQALYRHVLEGLDSKERNFPIVELARALLIVLYRFGLRTGEAAEVRTGDFTFHEDGCVTLKVTASALTSRKSGNALRLVGPVKLPQDEFKLLSEYRDRRTDDAATRGRDRVGVYLFATGGANKLEHVDPAQRLLIEAIRAASGDPQLRPRHLRHSFVSRLFLTRRDELGHIDSAPPATSCDAWGRTFATGHAAPDTGIISYTHVVDLAHHHYTCQLICEEVPLTFLSRLAGNDPRSLERQLLRRGAEIPAAMRFYQDSLRRNFPCLEAPDALANRVRYQPIVIQQVVEGGSNSVERLDMQDAWNVYANARIGRVTAEMSEHARIIRDRVRHLETHGRLVHRDRRRPQLSDIEAAAAATLWLALPSDAQLQALISSAVEWLRPRARQVLMPAAIAQGLQHRLQLVGLSGIQSRSATVQRRSLYLPAERGDLSTTWQELLAFLYAGAP